MKNSAQYCPTFSIAQARGAVSDLFQPKAWIYWADFLGSLALAWLAFAAVLRAPWWWLSALAYAASVLAFYRLTLFTHEISHFRSGQLPGFSLAWNLLVGLPFLMPSMTYATHLAHHRRKHYATSEDGEYLPFGTGSWGLYAMYFAQPFVVPLLAIVRFGVVAPLSWLSPALRDWAIRHASSMVIDPRYVRPMLTKQELRWWRLQEAGCTLMVWGGAAGLLLGITPPSFLPRVYLTALGVLTFNAFRTLGAHRFRGQGEEMTFVEQLLDSVNVAERPLISELWGPVGLRFHALHHLFPSLPYHNLPEAHRRLMAALPADSPYRQTLAPSLTAAVWQVIRDARATALARRTPSSPLSSTTSIRAA